MEHPEPEWTAENKDRKKGDTTFKICGWCEHTSSGSCRYRCYLSASCSLMKSYDREVLWDTPCKIKQLGRTDIESIISSKYHDIEQAKSTISSLEGQRKTLSKLRSEADKTPPLPSNRTHDYYTVGDPLYIFHDNKWNAGTCVAGYRHQDGCVSYVLDDYPDSKGGWGCGYAVPCVLKAWEYECFLNSPLFFKTWLSLSDKKYNGEKLDLDAYARAMKI